MYKEQLKEKNVISTLINKETADLKEKWLLESYWWWVKINKITKNIYSVEWYTWNISYFIDKNWKTILSTVWIMKNYYFKTASILAGYTEVKQKDGTYKLYKIWSIDINTKKIKPEKVVDKYSEEYFNAWMDIAFYSISMSILLFHKEATDWGYTPQNKEWLDIDIDFKVLKIKDLYEYKEHWQITDKIYKELLPQVQALLLEQIWDRRFERVWRQITKEEIEFYKKENLISSELYELAIQQLAEVEKLRQQEAEEKKREVMRKNIRGAMDDVMGKL